MKEYGLRRFALCARGSRALRRPSSDARRLRAESPHPIVLGVGEREGVVQLTQRRNPSAPMTLGVGEAMFAQCVSRKRGYCLI